MSKLLFSHSYFLRFDPKQWSIGQPYAPVGTLLAAAWMRENGYEVSLLDNMFSYGPEEVIPVLNEKSPDYFILYDDSFNYLTKMCLTNMREAAFDMMKFAKQKGAVVIVSSSDANDRFEEYLKEGADYVLMGEAEHSLSELIETLEKGGRELLKVPGIAYQFEGATIRTTKRELIRDLDQLPLPAWDLVNMEPYRRMWMRSKGYFSMNMATTRGCPFKCNWCAKPIYGNRYHSRSPEQVVEELILLKEKFQYDHIWFCDDIFGLKPGWVKTFADLVEEKGLTFRFKIQARADLLLQENYIKDLGRAGCENIWMGAESGSQRILDAMDKGIEIEQIYTATHLLKKNGIHPSFFIQFGYPGETREDIMSTIEMIHELLPYEIGISVSYPLPGTGFFEKVKMQMREKTNWTDSDELALMFRNTYTPTFYKQLHRYVHKSYHRQQGFAAWRDIWKQPQKGLYQKLKKTLALLYYFPATWWAGNRLRKLQIPVS